MDGTKSHKERFLSLTPEAVAAVVEQAGKPRVGVFVPDGNRRLTLAFNELEPTAPEFYRQNAVLSTNYLRHNLQVIFGHGLATLFIPLVSTAVLARDPAYQQNTVLEGLRLLLDDPDWRRFYLENGIRIRAYGDLQHLEQSLCSPAIDWLEQTQAHTEHCRSHTLFYGFTSPHHVDEELIHLVATFYEARRREPNHLELIESYYGEPVEQADFFIMSTKLAGLGAIPPLICGRQTQIYFLPAPGVFALTEETYRHILYDLIFCRSEESSRDLTVADAQYRTMLRDYYDAHRSSVIGLGRRIGRFWVPDL